MTQNAEPRWRNPSPREDYLTSTDKVSSSLLHDSTGAGFDIPKLTKVRSLRWKILSIAVISSTALLMYLAVISTAAQSNTQQMQDIYENKYPIQLLMQSSKHTLELVNHELEEAIITGDEELILSAEPLAIEFRRNMVTAVSLDRQYEDKILKILDEFETYYSNSSAFATQMLNTVNYHESDVERGKKNQKNYAQVMRSVHTFQQEQLELFAKAVNDTTKRASDDIVFALLTSVGSALTVLILATVIARSILRRIQAMVSSLKRIALENGSMKVRIELDGNDEMTELAYWFNTFIEKLERVTLESHTEIRRIAYTDTLSGLPNRRQLIENIDSSMALIDNSNKQLAVLFLDLDNFKPINDQFGHETGDLLIQQVSERLLQIVDKINGDNNRPKLQDSQAVTGRLGGDEFMLIVPWVSEREAIKKIAELILSALLKPFHLNGVITNIGVSIGISRYPLDAKTKESIIDCADTAMYEAKGAGKNTYSFYTSEMAAAQEHTQRIETALTNCVSNNELSMEYQPKFDLTTGAYIGVEALLRWHNERFGKLRPVEFIHLAEKTNIIHSIEEWVLNDSCEKIAHWLARGIDPGRVAINVSAKQIQQADLLEKITPIIERFDIPSEYLEFEISETSALEHMETVISNVRKLRDLKIHISMDDFGSGHSSLQLLINCNIDTVKIDRALTHKLCVSERYRSIVRSIINLAETLDIQCVAEGIENYEQLHMLRRLNCQSGQGFYFSNPISCDKAEKYMSDSEARTTQIALR